MLHSAFIMKNVKQMFSVLLIMAMMSVALPTRQAKAGIIFFPVGVGIALLIIGLVYHDTLLIILDADGNISQNAIESALTKRFSFIDDRAVIGNLATAIRAKADTTPMVGGKKMVSLTSNEILQIVEPTGLAELQPASVQQLIHELQ